MGNTVAAVQKDDCGHKGTWRNRLDSALNRLITPLTQDRFSSEDVTGYRNTGMSPGCPDIGVSH
jgi:hypothetical protein